MDNLSHNLITQNLNNYRIQNTRAMIPPLIMIEEQPCDLKVKNLVLKSRKNIQTILSKNNLNQNNKLLAIVGPCSIHDEKSALEYGQRLSEIIQKYSDQLVIVMRVYFEKPRTRTGWKGFINDPDLNNSFQINKGLKRARQLLLDLNQMGVPCGTEFLDTITPQYIGDLVSWGAIGARTVASQIHRELASGLSCPVGFKNAIDGNVDVAIDALKTARSPHHFVSLSQEGNPTIFTTEGNSDTHIILRGSKTQTNYESNHIKLIAQKLNQSELPQNIMVDCSHGNSQKNHIQQPKVVQNIIQQISNGNKAIMGVMMESHLIPGRQILGSSDVLTYGQSITDACMGWDQTVELIDQLAQAVQIRRQKI